MTGSEVQAGSAAGEESVVRRIATLARVPLAEAASAYAASGVAVFPCVPGGKRPLTRHGLRDASTDAEQILAWWRRWPMANVGLPTGQVSGLDVLDVDVRETGSGFEAFERLRTLGLATGWSMVVQTPSGGVHAYFPAVPGRPQRCWQAADAHIDFRGDGGYVLAPPSLIAGPGGSTRGYVVARVPTRPAAPLDADRVRALLVDRPGQGSRAVLASERVGADPLRLAAWVAARGEGERNSGLFWAACRLAEGGIDLPGIEAALTTSAENAGLPGAEIAATIRSATRTVQHRGTTTEPVAHNVTSPLLPRANQTDAIPTSRCQHGTRAPSF